MTRVTGTDCAATYNVINTHKHGEVDSDVDTLIKQLAIRLIENRSEIHSNKSQHLAERTEIARLRRGSRLFYGKYFHSVRRHHLCRQGVALVSN